MISKRGQTLCIITLKNKPHIVSLSNITICCAFDYQNRPSIEKAFAICKAMSQTLWFFMKVRAMLEFSIHFRNHFVIAATSGKKKKNIFFNYFL